MMVVALPLIDNVAGVEVEAPAEELGGVGDAPEVPDDAPDVPDDVLEPAEVLDVPVEVLVPDELLAVADAALGALVWTPTPAGEHPKSVTDKTNRAMVALENFMWPSLAERLPHVAERRHSITTEHSEIATFE